jgi:acyl carrier protein
MKDETGIYAHLTEIFCEVFGVDEMALTPGLSAKDVDGWDSFKQIEIIVSVEERFGIKLNERDRWTQERRRSGCGDCKENQLGRKAFFSEEKKQKTFTIPPLPNYPVIAGKLALAQK